MTTKTIAAELSAAAKNGKATEVAKATAAEAHHAQIILTAALAAEKASGNLFQVVREAIMAKCTFSGMEIALPALKESVAYRSAKATISGALKNGVKLVDADGKPRSKGKLSSLVAKKTTPKGNGKTEHSTRKATPAEMVKSALATLKQSSALRKQFAVQIAELAQIILAETESPKVAKAA